MSAIPTTSYITETLNLIKNNTPHLALYTASPNAGGGGTEVSGGSYARQTVAFGAISNGSMSNTSAVTFTGMPAATVTHFAVLSASTAGTMRVYGALNASAAVISGDQVQFPVGSITINLAGS